jgi:anti-sigma-K factor RskA
MTHEELIELVPLLAIGALPDAESTEVRRHLLTCASCRQSLAEFEDVGTALLASVPVVELPASIAANLRQRVASPQRAPHASDRAKSGRPLPVLPRWAWIGAAFAVLALLAIGAYALIPQTPDSPDNEMAQLVKTPGMVNVSIKGTDAAPKSWGRVVANPDSANGYLMVGDLASLPPQKAYQVWLVRDTERNSAALFTVDTSGRATVRLKAPDAIRNYREVGVTVEPAGGSPWPTTARVIGGALAQK